MKAKPRRNARAVQSRCRFVASALIATLFMLVGNGAAEAIQPDSDKKPAESVQPNPERNTPKKTARNPAKERQTEREVLAMVEAHLPDIKILLDQLREKEPRQYATAIRNLARSSRRLQLAEKRSAEAFEIEVQIVKSQSAINLLIAKLKVRDNKKDRNALREATRLLEAAEVERANHELAQLKSRFEKMKEQVAAAEKRLTDKESRLEQSVENNFQAYLKKSGRE